MFGIGAGEFVLILIAGLILFGPSKLPELGRSLGKLLREFRKAQAALSATLEESAEPEKKSPSPSIEKISEEKIFSAEKIPEEKKSSVTVDDVINLAKKNPIAEENLHEKIFNGGVDNPAPADGGASNDTARGNSNGTAKQPEPAKN